MNVPKGGIGFHGSSWEKALSLQTEGLNVDRSKQYAIFMYIVSPGATEQELKEKITLAARYAVVRSLDGFEFDTLQEAANRHDEPLPEARLPAVTVFASNHNYLLDQLFEPDTTGGIFHTPKGVGSTDIPPGLIQGSVRLEQSEIVACIRKAEAEAKTEPSDSPGDAYGKTLKAEYEIFKNVCTQNLADKVVSQTN